MKKYILGMITIVFSTVFLVGCFSKENEKPNSEEEQGKIVSDDKEDEKEFSFDLFNTGREDLTFDELGGHEYIISVNEHVLITINKDGTFEGYYYAESAGETGVCTYNSREYPCKQFSESFYSGKFSDLKKINDYEYEITVESLDYEEETTNYFELKDYSYESKYANEPLIEVNKIKPTFGAQGNIEVGKPFIIFTKDTPVDLYKSVAEGCQMPYPPSKYLSEDGSRLTCDLITFIIEYSGGGASRDIFYFISDSMLDKYGDDFGTSIKNKRNAFNERMNEMTELGSGGVTSALN